MGKLVTLTVVLFYGVGKSAARLILVCSRLQTAYHFRKLRQLEKFYADNPNEIRLLMLEKERFRLRSIKHAHAQR